MIRSLFDSEDLPEKAEGESGGNTPVETSGLSIIADESVSLPVPIENPAEAAVVQAESVSDEDASELEAHIASIEKEIRGENPADFGAGNDASEVQKPETENDSILKPETTEVAPKNDDTPVKELESPPAENLGFILPNRTEPNAENPGIVLPNRTEAANSGSMFGTTSENSDFKPESKGELIRKSGLAWSAGVAFFASVVFLLILGWFADLLLGTSPFGAVGGVILGSIIGFLQLFRLSSQILKKND